jgi:hypothetical protein
MASLRTSLPSPASARTRSEYCHQVKDDDSKTNFYSYAMDVVRECAEAWDRLITGKTPSGGVST